MGFRFSLQSANIVANLTFGKVLSCYRDILNQRKNIMNFYIFLIVLRIIFIQTIMNIILKLNALRNF